jgi:transposase
MSIEALKKAREALQLMYGCKMTLRDRAVVDAALAAIDAEAKPVVRMLTDEELAECCGGCKVTSAAMTWMRRSVSKAAEVWGLTIGEQG